MGARRISFEPTSAARRAGEKLGEYGLLTYKVTKPSKEMPRATDVLSSDASTRSSRRGVGEAVRSRVAPKYIPPGDRVTHRQRGLEYRDHHAAPVFNFRLFKPTTAEAIRLWTQAGLTRVCASSCCTRCGRRACCIDDGRGQSSGGLALPESRGKDCDRSNPPRVARKPRARRKRCHYKRYTVYPRRNYNCSTRSCRGDPPPGYERALPGVYGMLLRVP